MLQAADGLAGAGTTPGFAPMRRLARGACVHPTRALSARLKSGILLAIDMH
ncbi:MAG: hypothetical protein V4796_31395 [Burkholderia cenocepacia]